ncbi:hypothetical protein BCR35DRAFT_353223 [Leucosporidium creatinivorum]|uniref:RNA polymerase II-associated protein 1 C-terminal domain-containing protein n=1 Tax=Leucosporidium creatinivorum TaxID=106004 RepID=A0A1Y2F094_9BASI|nr:hypothetical protein BCR35DRAFT_353223 [Leucosporidium creatinivorum]
MDGQRIRPSLRDLADDYDQLAFPELEQGAKPAVSVTRTRPPTILLTSTPPPIPVIPTPPKALQEEATPPAAPKPRTKSRFALQREREAAERAAAEAAAAASRGTERFEIDLDGDQGAPSGGSNMPKLVGEVFERSSAAPPLPPSAPGPSAPSPLAERKAATGFPASAHLLFPRKSSAPSTAPAAPFQPDSPSLADPQSVPGLLASVSAENDNVIRGMSEAEILEEQRQIRESMGLSEGILRMLEARGRKKAEEQQQQQQQSSSKRRPAPEGAPAVPTRKDREEEVSQEDEEEGSPEYIRRHFFPDEPSNPNLDWMKAPSTTASATSDSPSAHAFDLQGLLLPASAHDVAPAPSTSHHVSSSTSFTIPSLLTLTTSSVPSQRSTSFLVLGRILANAESNAEALGAKVWSQLRLDAAQKAGYALRDNNAGAASASIALLAGLFASEVASPTPTGTLAPGAEVPPTILSSFLSTTPLPALAQHLASATLPPSSLSQILALLNSLLELANTHTSTKCPEIDLIVTTPNLLEAISKRFVARSWPASSTSSSSDSASAPTPSALTFLTNLARSSRDTAKAIFDRKLAEPPLRFLSIPPWELEAEERKLGYQLVSATFELWEVQGRYGIGTSMRTKGASVLDLVQERVGSFFVGGERRALEAEEIELVEKWFSLLTVWTTAAVNPHVTEHDILWTHVEDWGQSAMDASRWALQLDGGEGSELVLTKAWELLGAWLEGSKVNQSWRGEKQREWIKESLGAEFEAEGKAISVVRAALERLSASSTPQDIDRDASLVLSALQLSQAYEEEADPPTPALFTLDPSLVEPVFANLEAKSSWIATRLLATLLPQLVNISTRLTRTLQVLLRLRAGDEVAARDLVDWVLKALATTSSPPLPLLSSLDDKLELPALQAASLLRPFFTFAIVTASGGRVVGPLHPTCRDLKLTASLHPFARREPLLAEDWPLVALNELLRSGSSPVFQQLPQGWDHTELEVVRSSLALMRVVVEAGLSVGAPLLVYDLIKVFMLEKDNTTSGTAGAESDLFRDDGVQASMAALLKPLLVASQGRQRLVADTRLPAQNIEGVSSLISSAPFYQLYTDLIGLYDSISLSHPLFGLVLLPSLAMSYPVDYRKLLWIDYSHLLRMLRFPVDQVIVDRLGESALASYLAPRERNESLLGAYGDALVRKVDGKTGFLELVAVHHVSAALFDEEGSEPLAKKLAGAVVGQGSEAMVRRLLSYEQVTKEGDELKVGEACWSSEGEGWEARKQRLRVLVGGVGVKKLEQWGL